MTPYTGILKLAKLKFFMSNDLSTKTYKVALLLITQGDIHSMEQEISSAKVKPDRFIKKFEIEIRILLLNCVNILEYIW